MGFWILMAMLACALIAVVVALAIERSDTATKAPPRGDGSLRWLAVVAERSDSPSRDWAGQLADLLPPTVEPQIVHAPGPTLTALQPSIQVEVAARAPNVLLMWTALDDVLNGVSLSDYELTLGQILASLDDAGIAAVVGNVPDLTRLPGAVGAGLPEQELRDLTDRWNAAIARLAHHHGALVADLSELAPILGTNARPAAIDLDGIQGSTTDDQVAGRFLPVLRHALVSARRRLGDPSLDSL
jgi:hypothetical protein